MSCSLGNCDWNIVFVLVNIYHIAIIIYEKRPVHMDDKNNELYETLFKELTPYADIIIILKNKLRKASETSSASSLL